ncbi:ATP-binding cassette domain-containing protein [Mycoplasmatota bacterium]|nr:ATP-binding cassette domain-containing protein [Mycoplasmatota bacterium]
MIKLVGIHKIYEDNNIGFLALKDVSLDFKDDHFVCVLGKSGSGKTTLLNIIGGLDTPSTGHMVINGELTTKFNKTQWDYFRNYKIGFIFQNFSLIEHLTVLDNVMLSIKLQGVKEEEARNRAKDMLKRVHILDQADKLPKKLSGGQRQRVAIARALVNNPDVILADEPTGNLDKKTSKEVLELLKEISQDKLVIMVTHSKKIANKYADRIIELKDGIVLSDTKPYLNERVHILKPNIKHTTFRFTDKIKHAIKNIRMKKWRSFLLALGLAIGVTSYVLIDGISNGIKINVKKHLVGQVSSPDLSFHVDGTQLNSLDKDADEYVDYLLANDDIKAVRYDKNLYANIIEVNGKKLSFQQDSLTYKFTNLKDEELRLIGKPYGDGTWPSKNNEILLSYSYASSLYEIDNIKTLWSKLKGANITIASDYYYQFPYEIYDFNSEIFQSYPYIDEETEPMGYDQEKFGSYSQQVATQMNYYNQLLIRDNNIYFCTDYDLLKNYYSSEVKDSKVYYVVGINDSTQINSSIITKEEYWNLPSSYRGHGENILHIFDVYLTEHGKNHTFEMNVKYPEARIVGVPNNLNNTSMAIDIFVGIVQFIISLILIVSVVTASFMLLMVLLISVMERSREIGILRSLGATRSDILAVFVSESAVIGFYAGILGIILSIVLTFGGNLFIRYQYKNILEETFNHSNINLIVLKPISCIIAVIICILLAMIFGLFPAIKASKKTPINALKRL